MNTKDPIQSIIKILPLFGMGVILFYVIKLFWLLLHPTMALLGTLICALLVVFLVVETMKILSGHKSPDDIKLDELLSKKTEAQRDILRRLQRDEEEYLWRIQKVRHDFESHQDQIKNLETRLQSLSNDLNNKTTIIQTQQPTCSSVVVKPTVPPTVTDQDIIDQINQNQK